MRARLDDVSREKRGALSEAAAVHESRDAVLLELQAAKVANSDLKLALDRKASEQAASAALAAERGAEKEQADRKWAESLRTATSRFEQTMLEAEGEWVDKIEELETLWSKRLDAAEQRSAAERAELEEQVGGLVSGPDSPVPTQEASRRRPRIACSTSRRSGLQGSERSHIGWQGSCRKARSAS